MKRWIAVLLVAIVTGLLFSSCGQKASDWEYIQQKGTLVIGYTVFEPMNYTDENGNLIGFDTELAKAVCEKLGVTPEFVEIDWENKVMELNSKRIDCAWNGMTILEELKSNIDFSVPYSENYQACVIRKEDADKYKTTADMTKARIGVEAGSAGETTVQQDENLSQAEVTSLTAQRNTLLELKAGTLDVAVLDGVMALASVGDGTDFSDLMIVPGIKLSKEEYGIGFRKDSPETVAKVNEALQELANDGTLQKLQEKYPSVMVTLKAQ